MADTFKIIAIVCFVLAIAALLVTIILFFKLNIKKIISDLSGHTAKKYIEQQKEKKIKNEVRVYSNPAKEVSQISNNMDVIKGPSAGANPNNKTMELDADNEKTVLLGECEATAILGDSEATTVLGNDETTTILSAALLNPNGFVVEKDITITHTHEKINYDQWSIS